MATNGDGGMGFFMGIIVLIIFVALFFIYGLPYLRDSAPGPQQIQVPSQIDVNVQEQPQ